MSKLKIGTFIGLVALSSAFSMGNDCDIDIDTEDGLRIDVDDNDDFFDDFEDLFD
jgi:hypothetical protein